MAVILGAQGYGETTVSAIKLGSTTVEKIYLGDDVVYGNESTYWDETIGLVSDASGSTHATEAVISHASNLENTNADTYRLSISWTQSSSSIQVNIDIPPATNATTAHTAGTSPYQISAKYNSTNEELTIYSTDGYEITGMSVVLNPLAPSGASYGASNTLNNLEIDEDG